MSRKFDSTDVFANEENAESEDILEITKDLVVDQDTDITDRKSNGPFCLRSTMTVLPLSSAQAYAREEGVYKEDVCTCFWNELDEYEQTINEPVDVSCTFCDTQYDMSYKEFYGFFKTACGNYLEDHPDDAEVVEEALEGYSKRFLM